MSRVFLHRKEDIKNRESKVHEHYVRLHKAAAWRLRWDYMGCKLNGETFFGGQKDWNNTLITRLGEIAKNIHKATFRNAETLIISPELLPLFETLDLFDKSSMMVGSRYGVVVNERASPTEILIYAKVEGENEDSITNNRLAGVLRVDLFPRKYEELDGEVTIIIKKRYLLLG